MLKDVFETLFPNHKFNWKPSGNRSMGFCPFHDDKKSRSFAVYENDNGDESWYCFAERIGGNMFDAVLRSGVEGTDSERGARAWLVEHQFQEETDLDYFRRKRNEGLEKFREWTNELLCTSKEAAGVRSYVCGRRHILPENLNDAEVGYYPTVDEVRAWLLQNNLLDVLEEDVLPSATKTGKYKALTLYEHSLLFFYKVSYTEYSRVKARNVLAEKNEKRITWLGKKLRKHENIGYFSWFHDQVDTDMAVIVEGEFDVGCVADTMSREQEGANPPVYCFNSGGGMENGVKSLMKLGKKNIFLFPDFDDPGTEYAVKVATACPECKIIEPSDIEPGDDPASWTVRHNIADFVEACKKASIATDYLTRRKAQQYLDTPENRPEERECCKREFVIYTNTLDPSVGQKCLQAYSKLTEIPLEDLEAAKYKTSSKYYKPVREPHGYGIYMRDPKGKDPDWQEVSNVIVETLYDTEIDNGDGDILSQATVKASLADKSVEFELPSKVLLDDKAFQEELRNRLGSKVTIRPRMAPYLRDSINYVSTLGQPHKVQTYTGWKPDFSCYMAPGGYIDERGLHDFELHRVELPARPVWYSRYNFYPSCTRDELKIASDFLRNKLLKIYPYEVTLPILAHLFWSVIAPFIPEAQPYALWIWGNTGSKKSGLMKKMMCLFGDFFDKNGVGKQVFENWGSTGNSIEVRGYALQHLPYVVDDYKMATCDKKTVVSVLQRYGDRSGRGRLTNTLDSQKSLYVRGNMVVTGEDIVEGETSSIARTLLVHLTTSTCDLKLLKETDREMDLVKGVMTRFIQELCASQPDREKMKKIYDERCDYYASVHDRISGNLAANSIAWDFTAKFLGLEDLTSTYKRGLIQIARDMGTIATEQRASSICIDTFREMLDSGEYFLQGISGAQATEHSDRATCVGYIDDQYIYLSSNFLTCVKEYYRRGHETTLQYTRQAVNDQLKSDGWLVTNEKNGKNYFSKKINGSTKTVTKLLRKAIEVDEEANFDDEFAPGIIRGLDEQHVEEAPY